MKLCGYDYPEEPDSDMPHFWPVARAWADEGGYSALGSGMNLHYGEIEEVVQRMLKHSETAEQLPYIHRPNVSRQRGYSALAGINKAPCKRCRKELAQAFLNLFEPDAEFNLLRTDKPLGAGVLIIDSQYVGVLFAEFNYRT